MAFFFTSKVLEQANIHKPKRYLTKIQIKKLKMNTYKR